MSQELWIYVDGINPEPWTAGELGTKRFGKKVVPTIHKQQKLTVYQAALAEEVQMILGDWEPLTGPARVRFYFWRQIEQYESATGRKSSSHRADASNLTKAAEDALQKVLFKNDNQHWQATGHIAEQSKETPPRILIHYVEEPSHLPPSVVVKLHEAMAGAKLQRREL